MHGHRPFRPHRTPPREQRHHPRVTVRTNEGCHRVNEYPCNRKGNDHRHAAHHHPLRRRLQPLQRNGAVRDRARSACAMPVRGAAVRGGARCVREGGLRTARLQHAEHDRGHRGRSSTRAFRCSTCHRAPHVIPVADVRRLPRAAARASRRAVPLRGAQPIPMVRARRGVHGAKGGAGFRCSWRARYISGASETGFRIAVFERKKRLWGAESLFSANFKNCVRGGGMKITFM